MHKDSSAPSKPLPPREPSLEVGGESQQGSEAVTLGGFQVGSVQIRRALLFSFWDGIFNNGMVALNETFAVAAAVYLHASTIAIALLSALPLLLGSMAQYLAPALADHKKGRKHYVLLGVRLQSAFIFVAGFAGWLPARYAPWGYVLCFAVAGISNNMTGTFWMAWMGDLIPGAARGRHFAWRSVFFSWMYLSCSLLAGTVSRHYTSGNAPWALFTCVFTVAAALRCLSYLCLRGQYEPPARASEKFSVFAARPSRDFLTYCLAAAAFQGAATMSGPFFNVWYLRELHFDYFSLSMALCMAVVGSIAFAGFWGKMADNFGSSRVLWISGLLVAVIPLPYLFFQSRWFIWGFAFYSGATWAGYNLANFHHQLNATDKSHRSQYIAFFSLVVGLVGFCFSLLGGYLASHLPPVFGSSLRSLFLLSAVLRVGIFLVLFGKFREYREALPRRHDDVWQEFPGIRAGRRVLRFKKGIGDRG
jgi:MFS family permease